MYKIAVMGDRDSVLGFRALGLDVFPCEEAAEARRQLHQLARNDYAVIYITEQLSSQISAEIQRYKDEVTPAIILIPGREGPIGLGRTALKEAVERAVGTNILGE